MASQRPPIAVSLVHRVTAFFALIILLGFWSLTAYAEIWLDQMGIAAAKRAIAFGVIVLIPVMAALGGSGRALARGATQGLPGKKLARMKLMAANGVLVLAPAAWALAWLSERGSFGGWFWAIQCLELATGALNITLIVKNARDGLVLSGRLKAARRKVAMPTVPNGVSG